MNCREFDTLIPDFLEGVLDPETLREADAHRESCPGCARTLACERAVYLSLESTEPVKAPAGFAERLLAAVERETAPASVRQPSRLRFLTMIPVAAAACILGSAAFLFPSAVNNPAPYTLFERFTMFFQTVPAFPEMVRAWLMSFLATNWFAAATEPVPLPGMGFDLPVYFLALAATMIGGTIFTAWAYLNSPVAMTVSGSPYRRS